MAIPLPDARALVDEFCKHSVCERCTLVSWASANATWPTCWGLHEEDHLEPHLHQFMPRLLQLPEHVITYFQHPGVRYAAGP